MPELEYPPNVWLSVDVVIPLVKYATKLKISTQYIKNYKTNKKCEIDSLLWLWELWSVHCYGRQEKALTSVAPKL